MDWLILIDKFWLILLALIGVGFLIFIHELGHFLAAKRCGIRVDTFCLGFQPTVFGFRMRFFAFRHGETEYVIGMVPFGGYVKMAGEEITEEKTGADDEYASKPASQRALVLVAGATMNIAFAFLAFIIAFAIGVRFETARVGTVAAGSPAWEAGLRSGDRVVSVDGREVTDFTELATTLALAGLGEEVPLTVERSGTSGPERLELAVVPQFDVERGMPTTGIGPAFGREIAAIGADSAAAEAGLGVGDEILGITIVDGDLRYEVSNRPAFILAWNMMASFLDTHPVGRRVEFEIDPAGEDSAPRTVPIEIRPSAEGRPAVGITNEIRTIGFVRPGSPAAEVFQPGEEIVELGGIHLGRFTPWTVVERAAGSESVRFRTAGGREGAVGCDALIDWLLQGDLAIFTGDVVVENVTPGSVADRLGVVAGDRLVTIDGQLVQTPEQLRDLSGQRSPHRLTWWDGAATKSATFEEDALDLDTETTVPVGSVVADSPAAAAGVRPGDRIDAVDGKEVHSFREFSRAVRDHIDSHGVDASLTLTVLRDGGPLEFELTPAKLQTAEPLGLALDLDRFVLEKDFVGACVLGTERAVIWGKRIFLMVRALIKGEVHPKNLAGPVGIIDVTRRVVRIGFGNVIYILALISLNLGIFNLFPFPILDGGHLLFLAIEKIKGSPVSEKVQYYAHLAAFVLLISLALFVTYHDILRFDW